MRRQRWSVDHPSHDCYLGPGAPKGVPGLFACSIRRPKLKNLKRVRLADQQRPSVGARIIAMKPIMTGQCRRESHRSRGEQKDGLPDVVGIALKKRSIFWGASRFEQTFEPFGYLA